MTQPMTTNPHLRVARAAVLAGVLGALAVGVAYALARAAGAQPLAADFVLVGGVLLLAGLPGLIGSAVAAGRLRGGAVYGFLGGMLFRLPVGAGLALWGTGLAQSSHFSTCIGAGYLVLLVIEVLVLAPAVKATAGIVPPPKQNNTPGQSPVQTPAQPLGLPKESC